MALSLTFSSGQGVVSPRARLAVCKLGLEQLSPILETINYSPSVSDLTLFTVFMSLVTNVVNTDDIIAVIFPRWRAKTVAAMYSIVYVNMVKVALHFEMCVSIKSSAF